MVLEKDKDLFQKIYKKEREGNYLEVQEDLNHLLIKYPRTIEGEEEQLFRGELLLTNSIILIYKKNYQIARANTEEVVKIFEKYQKWDRLAHALNRIAETFRFEKQYNKAKEYTEKAIETLKKECTREELKKVLPPFWRELADALIRLEKLEEAENILLEAIKDTEETGDEFTKGHLALTLFTLYLKENRLEEAEKYLKIGEDILVKQAVKHKSIPTEIIIKRDWANFYSKKGETEKREEFLKEALKLAKEYGFDYLSGELAKD